MSANNHPVLLQLLGKPALSAFRLQGLLQALQAHCPDIKAVQVHNFYCVALKQVLSPSQRQALCHLLGAEINNAPLPQFSLLAIPRVGTISPWSSKATDIMQHCGLDSIERLERGILYTCDLSSNNSLNLKEFNGVSELLHDRMAEILVDDISETDRLFTETQALPLTTIDVLQGKTAALVQVNQSSGLALTATEIDYLAASFARLGRNPTDVELMMFAQVNSEHCRHKIFNSAWIIDGKRYEKSLFAMIRNTHAQHPHGSLSAYKDNAAVIAGWQAERFFIDPQTKAYQYHAEPVHIVMKVETHNHPTAIAPFAGAATGAGGEIRDEAATGRGAKSKAGLTGFSVSHLQIPGFEQPWENSPGKPENIVSALTIMLEGPIGAAAFNNEFGRPNLCGYFRTFAQAGTDEQHWRGYHKPIMIAGGLGSIREQHVKKHTIPAGALMVVLGGPAMQIGLGGGAASSVSSGRGDAELDFASVQRSNPEMQRRCQEVIDQCWALGADNPIISIHDVGAGGLSNALPELVHDSARGAEFNLRAIPSADHSMSPLAIWCNEAQERYVLAIRAEDLVLFSQISQRERCPFAVAGHATEQQQLVLMDDKFANTPIDIASDLLFMKPLQLARKVVRTAHPRQPLQVENLDLQEAARRVLLLPAVASKNFLITIGDRSIGGLVARDQMAGPWQVPVADVAVTASGFKSYTGEAMAMGERSPVALLDPAAAARMAVSEAITNIAAADISAIDQIKLSANWMAAAGYRDEAARLYEAVHAVAMELCPALGIAIPVGKDSLSMQTVWPQDGVQQRVTAPLSLIISAFAPVADIRKTLTPQLRIDTGPSDLILIDLSQGKNRLGGSCLAQVFNQLGDLAPDLETPQLLKDFFAAIQHLNQASLLLAYHDRSDGGLFACICEMAFAGHVGVDIDLDHSGSDLIAGLFSEESGAVIQVRHHDSAKVLACFAQYNLAECCHIIGCLNDNDQIIFRHYQKQVLAQSRVYWQKLWSQTSYHMQKLRDHPECAQQEYDAISDHDDPGLQAELSFTLADALPVIGGHKPHVAILREQGVNGHVEMAAAFDHAGFAAIDVHMSDILSGAVSLKDFTGLVACGGFSYGDVLGAGRGWANTILFNNRARDEFSEFFQRESSFSLGVCNGCQMLSYLRALIPGAEHWPEFVRNRSEQFEARLSLVAIQTSPSLFFTGMDGSFMPVPVAHGEGRVHWHDEQDKQALLSQNLVAMRYVDNSGQPTRRYPANPNGSVDGITSLTSVDGRVTIMMPHPERAFRTVQLSWAPSEWQEYSPWSQMFINCRLWLG